MGKQCADPGSFVRGSPNLTGVFLVDWRMDPNTCTSIVGQLSARWRADNGTTLNAGLVILLFFRGSGPVLLRNPIVL